MGIVQLLTTVLEIIADLYDRLKPNRSDVRAEIHNAIVESSTTGDTSLVEEVIQKRI